MNRFLEKIALNRYERHLAEHGDKSIGRAQKRVTEAIRSGDRGNIDSTINYAQQKMRSMRQGSTDPLYARAAAKIAGHPEVQKVNGIKAGKGGRLPYQGDFSKKLKFSEGVASHGAPAALPGLRPKAPAPFGKAKGILAATALGLGALAVGKGIHSATKES